ncbi:redox-sensing transcriptional repressor Rex [Halothermothrix orenii]|uniref:Redox-sensing transcriptional repressor Rex n=1 Tax=Halothermothrix orenii (strain H 168 / OCM 544 / DSM 9562) TaxID=373903 RepID=B8D1I3_HALOH|nr:redox-sensing transcriptional repressor Rex [Halothermothrix orenii]ACL69060.1 CoA-binding domain protein [Halothermothrix orenii H 168]
MNEVPQATIERLVVYYRYLKKMAERDLEDTISSKTLGDAVGTSAAQVRKDLSYFGEFGCKGVGYDINSLKKCLERILGFNRVREIALVGAGNLGRALVNYQGFKEMGMEIVEVFDCDIDKINNRVGRLTVRSVNEMEKIIRKRNIKTAIIAVPEEEAQGVASSLVKAGVKAIWNFAPVALNLPSEVVIYYEDLASSLVWLIYKSGHGNLKVNVK